MSKKQLFAPQDHACFEAAKRFAILVRYFENRNIKSLSEEQKA
jgi:hypothetical protein